jgi:hypothetical protein
MLTEFGLHQKEKALIGEMLLAYGEIEFALVAMLGVLFETNFDRAAKVLFRVNGEGARIAVADALLHLPLNKVGLGDSWNLAYGAAKHCKSIRNQYAHCQWFKRDVKDLASPIYFMNVDADAATRAEAITLNFKNVDLALLEKQHSYFDYALTLLHHVEQLYRKKMGLQIEGVELPNPKSIPAPPLNNPEE